MEPSPELIDGIRKLGNYNQIYTNNTPLVTVAGVPLLMHEAALAGLLAQLNMVFIGRSGPGKSQLISDIKNGIFNGDAVHLRGSADLKVRPVYCSIDLELYRQGRVDEAVKPRAAAGKMLHIMEEFNRAPPVIQNEWLAVGDRVLDIDGTQIPLGNGYSVAIGAANIGNGEFSGTFQSDNALKERLVLALDFDGKHRPQELDYFSIFENSCDPRVVEAEKADNRNLLVKLSGEVKAFARSIDYFVRMVQVYLATGLDEVELGKKVHSKEELPALGSAVEKDSEANKDMLNYVTAPSVRAVKVFGALVPSLAAVAISKGAPSDVAVGDACYAALELILPFSDSLPKKVLSNNGGSRRLAALEVVGLIRRDIPSAELLGEGIRKASAGILEDRDIKVFNRPRVRCFGRLLMQINENALREEAQKARA